MLSKPKGLSPVLLSIILIAGTAVSFAKEEAGQDVATTVNGVVVATVNGVDITMQDLGQYMNYQRATGQGQQVKPSNILDEMINREIIKQEALKLGLEKGDRFLKELEFQRANLLVNTLLEKQIEKADFSEDALKKEYDAQVQGAEVVEYKARHILVKSEDEATQIVKQLKDGGDFVALAKEKSTGPSGPNGGDLGWFQASSMVPEFADAVKGMKKGDTSSSAVKTQFGWHVIKLEDSRKKEAPSFEKNKDRIKGVLANRVVQNYLKGLRESAKVDVKQLSESATAEPGK